MTAMAAALQALILIAVYFFRQDLVFPRSIFVVFASLNATFLLIWRLGCSALLGGYPRRRVLVVGTNAAAYEVIAAIGAQQWLGLDVVGVAASSLNGTRRAERFERSQRGLLFGRGVLLMRKLGGRDLDRDQRAVGNEVSHDVASYVAGGGPSRATERAAQQPTRRSPPGSALMFAGVGGLRFRRRGGRVWRSGRPG
jgi:hypothetical protein